MLGLYKNVQELEESLSLPELQLIIEASRDKDHADKKFAAALKGIDLDEGAKTEAKDKFDEVQRRVNAKLTGASEAQMEMDIFGIEIETEE